MSDKPKVLALVAHPDDIEFMMMGTMLMLQDKGWEVHYMTIANGCCGTDKYDAATIAEMRKGECQAACSLVGAIWHPSVCNDLEVFHNWDVISKVLGVVREVKPSVILTQSPDDYMEDHLNSCRIAVTAAFCRGMLNAPCEPKLPPYQDDIVVYHAIPHGLMNPFRKLVEPEFFVNIEPHLQDKWNMLACHKSQKEWLDISQGMDAYQITMKGFMENLGARSGKFKYAEGFKRRSWLGYSAREWDPIKEALGDDVVSNPKYDI